MIQDIAPDIYSNEYENDYGINDDDYALIYYENRVVLKAKRLLRIKDIEKKDIKSTIHCGRLNGKNILILEGEFEDSSFYTMERFEVRKELSKEELWISGVGTQIRNWHKENRFCGVCGNKMSEKDNERALNCRSCGHIVYPKISPAIIVAVQNKDKILLANNVGWPEDMYSLLAGYVDIGETVEEAVIREVKEEVGVDVKNIKYYTSQPWPFSSSMMLGFTAEAEIDQEIILQEEEINDAKWFSRDEMINYAPGISIAGEMIDKFKKDGKF